MAARPGAVRRNVGPAERRPGRKAKSRERSSVGAEVYPSESAACPLNRSPGPLRRFIQNTGESRGGGPILCHDRAEIAQAVATGGVAPVAALGAGSVRARKKDVKSRYSACGDRLHRISNLGRVETVGESSRSTSRRDEFAAGGAVESGRGTAAFDITAPAMERQRGKSARLHGSRDRGRSAVRRVPGPCDGRANRAPASSVVIRRRRRRPLRVRRAVQFAARFEFAPMTRPGTCARRFRSIFCGEKNMGRNQKCDARAPPRTGARVELACPRAVSRIAALAGCPQEPEWHPEGDVWVHKLQVASARRRVDDPDRPQRRGLPAPSAQPCKPATTAVTTAESDRWIRERASAEPRAVDRKCVVDGYDSVSKSSGSRTHLNPELVKVRDGWATGPIGGWRRKWISNCWPASPRRTARDAAAVSIVPRWMRFSIARARSAWSTARRRRFSSAVTCWR